MIYHGTTNCIDLKYLVFNGLKRQIQHLNYKNNYISLLNECVNFKYKKIVDCFIFYNEIEMLNYRLELLKDVVDYFVIVESTRTFIGKPKDLYLNVKNDKIIHIVVDDLPFLNPSKSEIWKNEKFQRNCIARGLEQITLNPDDIIIISDVDEIPDPETLKCLNFPFDCYALEQDFYYYNLETKMNHNWYYSKIMKYSWYISSCLSLDQIRWGNYNFIKRGGWHLSYFGDTEFISNKIQNFSHQEYNKEIYTDIKVIENNIKNKLDLFGRFDEKLIFIPIHLNEYLPPNFKVSLI